MAACASPRGHRDARSVHQRPQPVHRRVAGALQAQRRLAGSARREKRIEVAHVVGELAPPRVGKLLRAHIFRVRHLGAGVDRLEQHCAELPAVVSDLVRQVARDLVGLQLEAQRHAGDPRVGQKIPPPYLAVTATRKLAPPFWYALPCQLKEVCVIAGCSGLS